MDTQPVPQPEVPARTQTVPDGRRTFFPSDQNTFVYLVESEAKQCSRKGCVLNTYHVRDKKRMFIFQLRVLILGGFKLNRMVTSDYVHVPIQPPTGPPEPYVFSLDDILVLYALKYIQQQGTASGSGSDFREKCRLSDILGHKWENVLRKHSRSFRFDGEPAHVERVFIDMEGVLFLIQQLKLTEYFTHFFKYDVIQVLMTDILGNPLSYEYSIWPERVNDGRKWVDTDNNAMIKSDKTWLKVIQRVEKFMETQVKWYRSVRELDANIKNTKMIMAETFHPIQFYRKRQRKRQPADAFDAETDPSDDSDIQPNDEPVPPTTEESQPQPQPESEPVSPPNPSRKRKEPEPEPEKQPETQPATKTTSARVQTSSSWKRLKKVSNMVLNNREANPPPPPTPRDQEMNPAHTTVSTPACSIETDSDDEMNDAATTFSSNSSLVNSPLDIVENSLSSEQQRKYDSRVRKSNHASGSGSISNSNSNYNIRSNVVSESSIPMSSSGQKVKKEIASTILAKQMKHTYPDLFLESADKDLSIPMHAISVYNAMQAPILVFGASIMHWLKYGYLSPETAKKMWDRFYGQE